MRKLIRKIIIPMLVVTSLLSSQVILPLQASAGNTFLDYDNPNKGGKNPYKLSLTSVTPQMLTAVVSCTGIQNKVASKLIALNNMVQQELNKLMKKATESISKALKEKAQRVAKDIAKEAARGIAVGVASGVGAAASTTAMGTGVPGAAVGIVGVATDVKHPSTVDTHDETAVKRLEEAEKEKIKAATKLENQQRSEVCLNGIAIALAKNQLTSMTKYTMNWINTGFGGDPLYVTNVNSFMDSITQEIIQRETNMFKNAEMADQYPFGRDVARSVINTYKAGENITSSTESDLLQFIPGATSAKEATEEFSNDFASGGWDAWMAVTQRPQNNPLGYKIKVSQDISSKVSQQRKDTTDEINRNGGTLDQKECAEYAKIDPDDDPSFYLNPDGSQKCLQYKTVTPGSVIKTKVDTYVNTPERQLELVKTMDDALNALFGALLAKFENQGLAGLRSSANNFTGTGTGGFGINQIFDADGNSLTGGSGTGFTTETGFFDLTRDLGNKYKAESLKGKLAIETKGVLQIQHDYMGLVKKAQLVLDKVIPSVAKLDYCIPGPNPSWFTNSNEAINEYINDLSTGGTGTIALDTIDETLNMYESEVNNTYGSGSPMQTASLGNTAYLKMSTEGLNITKDLASYSEAIADADAEYKQALADSTSNISKLNIIKDKVNKIIDAAQKRRTAKRAKDGLPAMKAICLAVEKVTYLDGDVLK